MRLALIASAAVTRIVYLLAPALQVRPQPTGR